MSEGKTLLSFGVFFDILYLFFVFVFFKFASTYIGVFRRYTEDGTML